MSELMNENLADKIYYNTITFKGKVLTSALESENLEMKEVYTFYRGAATTDTSLMLKEDSLIF